MNEFPKSIDINTTAQCNLRCTFCWGPDHDIPDRLDTQSWKQVISFFAMRGTKGIVFTGGEPLIRKDLSHLLEYAQLQGMKTTLSTNTILLTEDRAQELLPHVNEIGIPLDGSSLQKNRRMRIPVNAKSAGNHFNQVFEALGRIHRINPDIEVTIRTVVSQVNKDDIVGIGEVLHQHPDLWNRWKLYQFTPVSIGKDHADEHLMPASEFNQIGNTVREQFPDSRIRIYSSDERVGRYVFIGPDAEIFGVGDDGDYRRLGNFLDMDSQQTVDTVQSLINPAVNYQHA